MESEDLYMLRSRFYTGDYEGVIEEARSINQEIDITPQINDVIGSYVIRSLVGLGRFDEALSVASNTPTQQVLQLFVKAVSGEITFHDAVQAIPEHDESDLLYNAMVGLLLLEAREYKQCLQITHQGNSMEELGISVLALLGINRVDMAANIVEKMQRMDDDDTLSQVAGVWVSLVRGDPYLQEASNLLHELIEKFKKTYLILEMLASVEVRRENYSDALKILKEARSMIRASGSAMSASLLFNSMLCLQHLEPQLLKSGGNALFGQIRGEFYNTYPDHEYFAEFEHYSGEFDRLAAQYL